MFTALHEFACENSRLLRVNVFSKTEKLNININFQFGLNDAVAMGHSHYEREGSAVPYVKRMRPWHVLFVIQCFPAYALIELGQVLFQNLESAPTGIHLKQLTIHRGMPLLGMLCQVGCRTFACLDTLLVNSTIWLFLLGGKDLHFADVGSD